MADRSLTVGVLGGTGPQGRGLGLRLASAGYRVVVGSRVPQRAADTVARLRDRYDVDVDAMSGGPNREAADSDVVIVAVPFDGVQPLIESIADRLRRKIVVSCVNRLGFDEHGPHPIPVDERSATELIAGLAPGARVVGAFHHVPAGRLADDAGAVDMDVLVTGDDADACDVVCGLADAIPGMRGVRVGPLRLSRPIEELTAVVLSVNKRYGTTAGVRLTGLPDDV